MTTSLAPDAPASDSSPKQPLSDPLIWATFGPGLALGVVIPALVSVWASEEWALRVAQGHAVVTGAAVPLVAVLGMLAYLDPSPSVRYLSRWRRRYEAAKDLAGGLAEKRWPWFADIAALFAVGYFTGSAVMGLFDAWLPSMPSIGIGWGLGGFFIVAVGWLLGEAFAVRRVTGSFPRLPRRLIIGLLLVAGVCAGVTWLN